MYYYCPHEITKGFHYEILINYYLNKTIIQFLNPFGNHVIQAPAILNRWKNVNITRPMLVMSIGPIIILLSSQPGFTST